MHDVGEWMAVQELDPPPRLSRRPNIHDTDGGGKFIQ